MLSSVTIRNKLHILGMKNKRKNYTIYKTINKL
jgi:hypothetical protein